MKTINKRNLLLTVTSIMMSLNVAFAQAPAIEWQKTFGGSEHDEANCMLQTNDGGYIIAGMTPSNDGDVSGNHGHIDCWIVKIDTSRNIEWQKSYGGSSFDKVGKIIQTSDGGYIMAGQTYSNDGDVTGNHSNNWDYFVLKLDGFGAIQWQKCYGGSYEDKAVAVQQTADGGYVVLGSSGSADGDVTTRNSTGNHYWTDPDFWIIKLDTIGIIQWQKSLGGTGEDYPHDIGQTMDGGFIVTGTTNSVNGFVTGLHGMTDFWTAKLDSNGNLQWQRAMGGAQNEEARSVSQTVDGGFVIAGFTESSNGDITLNQGLKDFWIVKTDANGIINWQKTFGGSNDEDAYSIQQTNDGGYIVAGKASSNNGNVSGNHGSIDFWVIKLDDLGNLTWQKALGGTNWDYATSIVQTYDGNFVAAGPALSKNGDVLSYNANVDYWIVKLTGSCAIPTIPTSITVTGGTVKVCSGDTRTYTTSQAAAGVTYSWTVPAGAFINNGQGTHSINVTYDNNFLASGVISVVKTNSCGTSAPRNLTVQKNNPAIPSAISGPKFGLCGGRDIVFSVQQVQGMTYNWTVPGLANITSGQGSNSITVNFQSVNFLKTISVTATNSCGTSAVRTLTIRSAPEKPGGIIGAATVCANSTGKNYSIDPVYSAVSYTWIGPTGSQIAADGITSLDNILTTASNAVTIDFGAIDNNSTIKVKANNNCGSSALRSLQLTGGGVPFTLDYYTDPNNACGGCNGWLYVWASVGESYEYTYLWSNGSTEDAIFNLCPGIYSVTVTDNGGCNSQTAAYQVYSDTWSPIVTASIVHESFPGAYDGEIHVTALAGGYNNFQYYWSGPVFDPSWEETAYGLTAGTYTVVVDNQSYNGCSVTKTYEVLTQAPRLESGSIGVNASVYPNPTNGLLTLVLNPEANTQLAITVNDVSGKEVMKENLTVSAGFTQHQMNLQYLSDGMYFLTLQSTQGKQVIKITKE